MTNEPDISGKYVEEFETFSARVRKVSYLDRNGRTVHNLASLTDLQDCSIRDFNFSSSTGKKEE